MKIYFAGSIRGGRDDAVLYMRLIDHLKQYGEVLTEHIGAESLDAMGEQGLSDRQIHDRDLEWVLQSDVVVAEVTTASLGVGYEVGVAVENGIRTLCLHRPLEGRQLSAMIAGCPLVTNRTYSDLEGAKRVVDDYFDDIK